jgi:hypothetical protein
MEATVYYVFYTKYTLENTQGAIKIGKIQRIWQHRLHKTSKQNKNTTQCVEHHYAQTNTNNVNKIWTLLQTTGSKDEPNIVSMRKS